MFSVSFPNLRLNLSAILLSLTALLLLSLANTSMVYASEETGSGSTMTGSGSTMTGSGSTIGETGSGSVLPPATGSGGIVPLFFLTPSVSSIGGPVLSGNSGAGSDGSSPDSPLPNTGDGSGSTGGDTSAEAGINDDHDCPYLTAFMKFGTDNDSSQVMLLQRFLRNYEQANVNETGIFDENTLSAVHAFQQKYTEDILTPWGISTSTGIVSITTRKKINEIVCHDFRKLTPEERAEMRRIIQLLNS